MRLKTIFIHNIIYGVVCSFIVSGCASSLQKKNIEPPRDVKEKLKIVKLSDQKQPQAKELKVVNTVQVEETIKAKPSKKGKKPAPEEKRIVQKEEVRVVKNPFKVGEIIKLDLYYIGIKAATLTIEIKPFVEINGRKAFHFNGIAETSALMKLIYKAYDVIDCYVDHEKFVPLTMTLKMDETKQNVSMVLNYDHEKQRSRFWKKRIDSKGEVTEIKRDDEFTRYAQDIFSSLYYMRTNDMKVGDKVQFVIHDNGKNWNMTLDVVKKERIWTRLGDVNTLVLHPTVERNGEKFTKGAMTLWVTDDEKKVPVRFEAEVKIGSMKGQIKDYIVPKE
ncbi:MAG: DUF3108 domain-containing protein [Pseudomonadota bacterium]